MAVVATKSFMISALAGLLFCAGTLSSPAQISKSGFDEAKELYQKKQYAEAAKDFQILVDAGDKRPIVYVYLAHSLYMQRNKAGALKIYRKIASDFPGTAEARIASSALRKFGVGSTGNTRSRSANYEKKRSTKSLLESIDIIPPRFGHTPVSQNTIRIVRGVIAGLPKRLYRILNEGGAKLHIGTNMVDRWPDSSNGRHPADGHLYCNEPGRTYDLNMYVFERRLARAGSTDLGKVWSDRDIRISTYMQCAHAFDYMMEHLSSDADYSITGRI